MTVVIPVDFERQPLREALRQLADETGYDIVIDSGVAERAKEPVTLTLNIVWLDNALNLLTEMAGLDWYWMDRIVYVTSRENAKLRRQKIKALTDERPHPARDAEVNRPTVSIDCQEQPLHEVLRRLGSSATATGAAAAPGNIVRGLAGVQAVVDVRVADKAKTPVTARLDQVPPATAIRVLADMADLAVVPMDGLFYVTSKENARAMQGQPAK
jgi:hypothetical protein